MVCYPHTQQYKHMNLNEVIIAIAVFFATLLGREFVGRFFAEKDSAEDKLDSTLQKTLDEVLSQVKAINSKLPVFETQIKTLFENDKIKNLAITKLNEEILEIHKKQK